MLRALFRLTAAVRLAFLLLIVLSSPAFAAEVDLSPIIEPALAAIAAILMLLVSLILTWGFKFLRAKTGIQLVELEDKIRDAVNAFAYRGIDAALLAAKAKLPAGGKITIDNDFVAMAANYLVRSAPDYLKKLGLMKADGTFDMDRIKGFIEARIPTSNAAQG
jgi:hypothetical protein